MGESSSQTLTIGSFYIISDASQSSLHLLTGAWTRIDQAFRPSTASAHCTRFRTFIAFLLFLNLSIVISTHNVLVFLEYLVKSSISPKVVKNYLSSIASMASFYRIPHQAIQSEPVKRFLRSISINSSFSPTHRGIFNIHTLTLFLLHVTGYRIHFCSEQFSLLHFMHSSECQTLPLIARKPLTPPYIYLGKTSSLPPLVFIFL